MQENQLFEYAVIRIVPQVEREEFMNVGVVLYCSRQKFLQVLVRIDEQRLCAFSEKIDISEVAEYLNAFTQICAGGVGAGPIGNLPIAERFRWLTATRSTVVQTSKVHPGLCIDAAAMLSQLYTQLVL
ncbi:MAG: DUF3037 domain-containing protein [Taibaiella sp.]|nr:DUF3037 domain-containing protein [Taibaiella sp.]